MQKKENQPRISRTDEEREQRRRREVSLTLTTALIYTLNLFPYSSLPEHMWGWTHNNVYGLTYCVSVKSYRCCSCTLVCWHLRLFSSTTSETFSHSGVAPTCKTSRATQDRARATHKCCLYFLFWSFVRFKDHLYFQCAKLDDTMTSAAAASILHTQTADELEWNIK